jgi:glycosyltransferase involved in cell wall biosynthesis
MRGERDDSSRLGRHLGDPGLDVSASEQAMIGVEPGAQYDGPVLSVVLPNYNHGRYLSDAIEAIATQDRPPDEIIVIDDASTDDSREVLAGCKSRHPHLNVLFNEQNRGAIPALQRGLEAARGRYIYFGAADDRVLPGFFSHAIDALEATPTVGLFCAETILLDGATGRRIGARPAVRPLRSAGALSAKQMAELLKRADNFIHTGSSVFRRESVLDKGGFRAEAGSFSDGLLGRRIALTEGMWFAPAYVATWCIHSHGLSRTVALDADKALGALATVPKLIENDRNFPTWYPRLFERRFRFNAARLALEATPPNKVLLDAMAANTPLDRAVIGALTPFLPLRAARLMSLAWLSLRLRPFRLRDVAFTALDRWAERRKRI